MSKTTKRNVLISAVLTIALCLSLITGATFALFTSESKTNITVKSGKVDVVAVIDENSVQTKQLAGEYADGTNKTFAGKVSITDNAASIENFVPGDGVKFNVIIKNNSNVTVSFRTVWMTEKDDGLLAALTLNVGGESYGGETLYADWVTLEPGSDDLTVPVEIYMDESVGNRYQELACELLFQVEAVQGNAPVDNDVARVGDETYESFASAVAAVNAMAGDDACTLEIIRPGTYPPFRITRKNVTVKGIIGESKATSTVIRNTETKNIEMFADNGTLCDLWIDDAKTTGDWTSLGAVNVTYEPGNVRQSDGLTVDHCLFFGNENCDNVFNYFSPNFTMKNSSVSDYNRALYMACDNTTPTHIELDNNTFVSVSQPFNGYFGGEYTSDDYNIVITNNTFADCGEISLMDYAQRNGKTYKTFTANVSGNKGNVDVLVYDTNKFALNGNRLEASDGGTLCVFHNIHLDTSSVISVSEEGSRLYDENGETHDIWYDGTDCYLDNLIEGTYRLVDDTGIVYVLEVTGDRLYNDSILVPVTAEGLTAEDDTWTLGSLNALLYFAAKADGFGGKTAVLATDIDLAGVEWTPIRLTNGTFDGNGKTVSNMTVVGGAAVGFFGSLNGTVKNLTFTNARVTGHHWAGVVAGYSTSRVVKIENCHVNGATVLLTPELVDGAYDNGDKAGGIIGYLGYDEVNTATVSGCSVRNATVMAFRDIGGIVGCAGGTVTGNTVENIRLVQSNENAYEADTTHVDSIVGRALDGSDVRDDNTATGVVNNTVNRQTAATSDELKDALTKTDEDGNAEKELSVALGEGTYKLPNSSAALAGKDITITGTKDTVIDIINENFGQNTGNTTFFFDGVTVACGTADFVGIQHSKKAVFKDCVITGKMFLYAENVEFINCTFINKTDYCVWTYGAKNVTFEGCTFETGGKAVLIYNEQNSFVGNYVFNDCTFVSDGTLTNEKAAIETGIVANSNNTYTITVNNTTVEGFGENPDGTPTGTPLFGNKNSMDKDHLHVIKDGEILY